MKTTRSSGTKRANISDEYAGVIDDQNENYNVIGQKRLKKSPLMPIIIILTKIRTGEYKPLVCLLDTGTTSSIVMGKAVPHADIRHNATTTWRTKAGTFTTNGTTTLKFMVPEFSTKPRFEYSFHVDTQSRNSTYDAILGTNFMEAFQIDIRFSTGEITYKDASIPMRDRGSLNFNLPHILRQAEEQTFETEASTALVNRMTDIVESKYEPANLREVTANCPNLSQSEKQSLYNLLKQYEPMFDGQLGAWNMEPISLRLKPDARPFHARAYTIPKIYEETVRNEIQQLVQRGVLRRVNRSEWAAPTFIVPKKLNPGQTIPTARVVSDFRKLNEVLVRHPYPVPKIQHLLMTLESFRYSTSLDLVQGYYQMPLDDESRKLATIVLPFGKYEYTVLPMGIKVAGDIFQQRMNDLLGHLPFVRCYLDDVLIVTKGTWDEHLQAVREVLECMNEKGLKINAMKSFFGKDRIEYLGYDISQEGIRPQAKKIEAIKALQPPKTRKQLRSLIGMINFYRDCWRGRSHLLSPLTRLMSKSISFKWTPVEQKAFDDIKAAISKESLLTYPDFAKPFDVYTDASDKQLGAVILQEGKPIAHFSRTLNSAQRNYTVTDKELLSIVELLKEFRDILYGHRIRVFTDHKNLTCYNLTSQRVMRWRLVIEEFGIEIIYIKGSHNVAADALSRLPRDDPDDGSNESSMIEFLETYNLTELPADAFPITYKTIEEEQNKSRPLLKALNEPKDGNETLRQLPFVGGGSVHHLICNANNRKIVLPKSLQDRTIQWYHEKLQHPGRDRLYESIFQHFDFPKKGQLREMVAKHVKACDTCQKSKKTGKKYGKLPEKKVESQPWETLHVDMYGPKTIRRTNGEVLQFQVVTMIDPVTGWFEMVSYDDGTQETISNLVEMTWLMRYPRPSKIITDRGGAFTGHFFKNTMENDFGIEVKYATTANPQANAIVERIHQVIGNMLRTLGLEDIYLLPPPYDPFQGVIAAICYAIRTTWHSTMQATPGQLVFGRDMILNIRHIANWNYMQERRQKVAAHNNKKENAKRIPHKYSTGDLVLKSDDSISPTMQRPYMKGHSKSIKCGTTELSPLNAL